MGSHAFDKAYKKGISIWKAKKELHKLQVVIETLQAVCIDAEKRQESSAAVKKWVQRLKSVFYDAEDLFDEFATENLLKQQMMEGKNKLSLKNKVRVYCSMLNPVVSRNSIAKKVKDIRERLVDISIDMTHFGFVQNHAIEPMRRDPYAARCSIDAKYVIGRDEDKKAILEMLFVESSDTPVVISIEGIGGMGKTTLAHLIYNAEKVSKSFEKRWFTCISNITDEREVLGKIYQSVSGSGYSDLTMFQLQEKIREFITGKKYLLVLDDVWEDHHGRWVNRKSLLSSGAKGSKIVVTTRLPSVGIAMGAVKTHSLRGLSGSDSWNLFRSLSFASGYENDPRREIVGRKLLKRCRGVPLAIWCIGSLLHNKTIQEWEEIERGDIPVLGGEYNDETMSILKLSYDHLTSNLKYCFTYCCLFPKDYELKKKELIHHWIAQGYINVEEGESSFMHLLRMGFFQEMQENEFCEIVSCKMHDLMHDLAVYLSGGETIMLDSTPSSMSHSTRHVSLNLGAYEGGLKGIPASLFNVKALRSCMLFASQYQRMPHQPTLSRLCASFKLLRTLELSYLKIEDIPPSVGELKLVRYLDLSENNFEKLPDSITKLVNLLVLNVRQCRKLKVWPLNFKKLIKLWALDSMGCDELRLMPEGLGEISHLQYLSEYKVGKGSELAMLNGLLEQLRGYLLITFCEEIEFQDGLNLELPVGLSLHRLHISRYPGQRIRGWGNDNCSSLLEYLELRNCKSVKYLPHLSCLPSLKSLKLESFGKLEFMEDEEEEVNSASNKLFFPCLEKLTLLRMLNLKGWRRGKEAAEAKSSSTSKAFAFLEFSRLSKLHIKDCPNLTSFPHCPTIQEFTLEFQNYNSPELTSTSLLSYTFPSLQTLEILTSLRECSISYTEGFESLHIPSPHFQKARLACCRGLKSVELEAAIHVNIRNCGNLKNMRIAHPDALEKFKLSFSSFSAVRGVDWDHIPNLSECSCISALTLEGVDGEFIARLLSSATLQEEMSIFKRTGSLTVPLTSLQKFVIKRVPDLKILNIKSQHLRRLTIRRCSQLTNVHILHPTSLTDLTLSYCPALGLLTGVDWDALTNLRVLRLCPPHQELPQCLLQRRAPGLLRIRQELGYFG